MSNGANDDLTQAAIDRIKQEILGRRTTGQTEAPASSNLGANAGVPLTKASGLQRLPVHASRLYTPVAIAGGAAVGAGDVVYNLAHGITHVIPIIGGPIDLAVGATGAVIAGGAAWRLGRKVQAAAKEKVQRDGLV